MEALEQHDKQLASKVYALARRQANNTEPSPTPPVQFPEPTTPFLFTSTSSFEVVMTNNGVKSTLTELTVIVKTATPTNRPTSGVVHTTTVNPQLQSLGVRTSWDPTLLFTILLVNFGIGFVWLFAW
jgi:hypothetical protein